MTGVFISALALSDTAANVGSQNSGEIMKPAPTIRLADYQPPSFLIDEVHLTFHLAPGASHVTSRIGFRRNPEGTGDFVLNGENLGLIWAKIDGTPVSSSAYDQEAGLLRVAGDTLPDRFLWEAEVAIDPDANRSLSGLYTSKGMFCTQCEAEGFRRITFYPDRPDVMATFTVRIEGDAPVMLSNGNPIARGEGWVEWHDPWPKPSYLFALVAGDLESFDDTFTTMSGRKVDLRIWVRPGDRAKCAYAMDSLKRAMKWDEEVYGREYDLDLFQIVAVDDFNMGAMENKGLNIFNSKYVLASPETATDGDYERIEGIIAHEYFHNWTGDRITCRDWFQLSLKEGLTVFRDQSFSGDQRGQAVKRINEVAGLRARQFSEDAGPLAHPVRPAEYKEINNFYTATIYQKGAEVISMLKTLVGDDAYRRALDLYFERHDGQACTIENWLGVFEDTTGRDLSQFKLWYSQSGTPRVRVHEDWQDGTYTLTLKQSNPATPGQTDKKPQVIPVAIGLLNPNGDEVLPTTVLELSEREQSFAFHDLAYRPVASILRGFSAPVILERDQSEEERLFLLENDTDPFNKWEAAQRLATDTLVGMVSNNDAPSRTYLAALQSVLRDTSLDPAFRALVIALPGEDGLAKTLADLGQMPDPLAIHAARRALGVAIATLARDDLAQIQTDMILHGPYSPHAEDAGKRALRGAALALVSLVDGAEAAKHAFDAADNMTEQLAALSCLLKEGVGEEQSDRFFERWKDNDIVLDKWFMLEAGLAAPEKAVQKAVDLAKHPRFDWKNPNRFRSLISGLTSMNCAGFHDPSGKGYVFLADWIIRLDAVNPQTSARMTTAFQTWKCYGKNRRAKMRAELDRMAAIPDLSLDTREMVERILAS